MNMNPLKTGYSFFSFAENIDLQTAFNHTAKAGYDGAELIFGTNGYLTPNTKPNDIIHMRKMAEDIGLEIPSVGVWSLWENNLVSDAPATRQKAEDIILKQIDAAHLLGAKTVLIVPGYVGCDFVKNPEKIRYDKAWERAQNSFAKLAPVAQSAGIKIGIENVWNKFLLSPLELVRFIDEINSESLGIYFDVGNCLYIGYPEHWIEIFAHRIVQIHLSDYRCSQSGLGAFVDLFAGDVDFSAVSKALAVVKYEGYLILEMLPNYKQFPEISCFSNKYAVDKIIDMIKASSPSPALS
jgi:AP endonuclease, family 2